ncbi:Leukotoxin translocation ATP-binding protein LktB [Enterobacter cloacae]|uniref:Leukotoxin translocation ATP-binding protein LktB n=1 Tax=Enterobacter cloacae TaxID=550 RepID=A0A377LUP6_ENTCL|nr:Leukotoxin translocation ATP-binding protein LktB [Enterobacter cloacae]
MPRATDDEIFAALELTGAASFVQKLPKGLDYPIMENGVGLSGASGSLFCWRVCCCATRISS